MLSGKKILVTGATSGIGNALVPELVREQAQIIAVGRNEAKLREMAQSSPQIRTLAFDLTDIAGFPSAFDLPEPVDGVVYSAGIYETTLLRFFSAEKHEQLLRINLTAPIALVAQLLKSKKLNRGASIVLLSSILGPVTGLIGSVSYAASKSALVGCVKSMALELAKYEVRINCVSPGMVETEMTSQLDYMSAEAIAADKARYPLGKRYAKPGEVTSVIRFLLSDEASFITGSNVVVDGGCSVQ